MRVHETSACKVYNPSPRPVTLHDGPPMLAAARHIVSTSLTRRQVRMSEKRSDQPRASPTELRPPSKLT